MGLPQLKSCCCGCNLKTGTLILLWLHVIGWGMILLGAATPLSKVPINDATPPSEVPINDATSDLSVYYELVIFLIVGIITAVGVVGLYGVNKDRHSYLIPYLSVDGCLTMLETIGLLVYAIFLPLQAPENEMSDALAASAGLLISAFLGFAIGGYYWLVVYSYYRILKERSLSRNIP